MTEKRKDKEAKTNGDGQGENGEREKADGGREKESHTDSETAGG